MPEEMSNQNLGKNLSKNQMVLMVALFVVLAGGFLFYNLTNLAQKPIFPLPNSPFTPVPTFQGSFSLKQFKSAQEFQQYIQDNQQNAGSLSLGMAAAVEDVRTMAPVVGEKMSPPQAISTTDTSTPQRVSGTNVQVVGIDEPDIVKTNGQQIYLSSERYWYTPMPVDLPMQGQSSPGSTGIAAVAPSVAKIAPYPIPEQQKPSTHIIDAFPPAELAKLANIDTAGQLLLNNTSLIVLGSTNGSSVLTGFDVAQPASPAQLWQVKLSQSNQLVASRMMNDKLYVITQTYLYSSSPCPYVPLTQANGQELRIACTDIYYPDRPTSSVDSTFTVMVMNPKTGVIETKTSFVGSGSNSVIYVSPTAIYLTYQSQADMVKLTSDFITEKGGDLFPASVTDKLTRLQSYDISNQAKMIELQSILDGYQRSLSDDDRLRVQNELQNRMQDYLKVHSREIEQTLIVKLNASDLSTAANGGVPGTLLNQFSLDEYQGNLRVATTFGQGWTQFGRGESASDVYILDSSLRQRGVVTDLGKGERIYAVRFLADKGYVVTFKQVDPFYIVDLANPDSPQLTGELKIPGYSSYLHPIGRDRVLGVGKEDNMMKVSLFDVSDDRNPRELSKYKLDEYWSELLTTHHAFLLDEKHQVFFMPGSKGGYVFSYANDQLKLAKALSQDQVQRALFINDYLYVISENQITVLNEKDWQTVKELSL